MQVVARNSDIFDAVVVGSGATGGWAAKLLSESGMRVCVLEAGPPVSEADFTEHVQPYELKYRGSSPEIARNRPVQSMKYACRESNYKWFVDDIENPYTTPDDKPFQWTRCRILGGRSLTWARQSYRLSDFEFKSASRDGYGIDWPFSYEEIAPYYDRVERYVGVSGSADGLKQLPDSVFLPPMGMTCGEKFFVGKVKEKLDRDVIIGRTSIVTRQHNGRAACHYCGPCEQGCITYSYFSSPFTTLKDALATGRTEIRTDSVAYEVLTDKNTGLASGIAYVDRLTRVPREVRGKVVLLCASTLESTRLLMLTGKNFANSSGAVGHYLADHVTGYTSGVLPFQDKKRWTGAPNRPNGLYVPRFRNLDRPHTNGMIRGYACQAGNDHSYGDAEAIGRVSGFGAEFKKSVRLVDETRFSFSSSCETLPRYDNYVELDKNVTDAWGIPALRIHASWCDNDLKLRQDAIESAEEMLHAAGASDIISESVVTTPGGRTHEVGTARMGEDPKRSVLNGYAQSHDVKNLFITDGAAFTTVASQNPTLTMMAVTMRACDYIIEKQKRGELA